MTYPSWVYTSREDVTKENMKRYDREQEAIHDKCLELNPEYHHLGLRERFEIWKQAEDILKGATV